MKGNPVLFITGSTGFIGKRLVKKALEKGAEVYALAREGSEPKLLRYLEQKKVSPDGLYFVIGDICAPGVIKDPAVAEEVQERTTHVIHGAAVYDLSVPRPVAKRVNVDGTRAVLEFASKAKKLKRFTHLSTIAVSGDYRGIFYEEMLDVGQGFTDHYGRTKFIAEKLVREWESRFPVTIIRPGAVVGEMATGETEKFDGPYIMMRFIYASRWLHLVVPGSDQSYLEVVPVDVLAEFILEITLDSAAGGRTFTVVDPEPMSMGEFIDRVYERISFYKPLFKFSLKPVAAFVKAPVIKPVLNVAGRIAGYPVEGIHYVTREVLHDASNTLSFAARKNMRLPRFNEYIDAICTYFEKEALGRKH